MIKDEIEKIEFRGFYPVLIPFEKKSKMMLFISARVYRKQPMKPYEECAYVHGEKKDAEYFGTHLLAQIFHEYGLVWNPQAKEPKPKIVDFESNLYDNMDYFRRNIEIAIDILAKWGVKVDVSDAKFYDEYLTYYELSSVGLTPYTLTRGLNGHGVWLRHGVKAVDDVMRAVQLRDGRLGTLNDIQIIYEQHLSWEIIIDDGHEILLDLQFLPTKAQALKIRSIYRKIERVEMDESYAIMFRRVNNEPFYFSFFGLNEPYGRLPAFTDYGPMAAAFECEEDAEEVLLRNEWEDTFHIEKVKGYRSALCHKKTLDFLTRGR